MQQRDSRASRIARLGVLTAAALIVFVIEQQLPNLIPVPGAKLGLANIFTVYAVYHFSGGEVLLMLLTRIFLGTVFGGNMMTLPFSLSGGLLCLAGMLLLRRAIDERHIPTASVFGAVLHNLGQTAAAIAVMKTTAVIAYLPFLTLTGCIAGAFTGLTAQLITARLHPSKKEDDDHDHDAHKLR